MIEKAIGFLIVGIFGLPMILGMIVLMIFIDGLVVRDVWNWLAVPVMGWKELSTVHAIALSTVYNAFSFRVPKKDTDKHHLFKWLIGVFCIWLTAYILKTYFLVA